MRPHAQTANWIETNRLTSIPECDGELREFQLDIADTEKLLETLNNEKKSVEKRRWELEEANARAEQRFKESEEAQTRANKRRKQLLAAPPLCAHVIVRQAWRLPHQNYRDDT